MFNPQARWDRQLPADPGKRCEAVEVFVRFSKGGITPLYFVFKDSRFEISRVNYSWTERKGRSKIYYFSVADKSDNYCLFWDTEAMSWRLVTD